MNVHRLAERRILLREAADLDVHPPFLWGRFNSANELVYAVAKMADGQTRSWSREPGEDAEMFALRIVRDLCEAHQTGARHALVLTG
jgi:hypothetical protein